MNKRISLNKQEREFLAEEVLWELMYIDVDLMSADLLHKEQKKYIEREHEFYQKLYNKLKEKKK